MQKLIITLYLNFLFCFSLFAFQEQTIEQIKSELPNQNIREQFQSYMKLRNLTESISNKISLNYGEKALTIAKTLNDKNLIATAYQHLSANYFQNGDYDKALDVLNKSIKLYSETNNLRGVAKSKNNLGNILNYINDFENALISYNEALEIFNKLNLKNDIIRSNVNIGTVYLKKKEYDKAFDFFIKSLEMGQEINDNEIISVCYNNLALTYKNKKDYKKALEYYQKSIDLKTKVNDLKGLSLSYLNIGNYFNFLKDYDKASDYYKKTIELSAQTSQPEVKARAYNALYRLFKKKKNFEKALEYHETYSSIKDSLFNTNKAKKIAELQTLYEVSENKRDIASLQQENNTITRLNIRLKILNALLIAITLLLFYSFFSIYKKSRHIKKLYEELKDKNKKLNNLNTSLTKSQSELADLVAEKDKFLTIFAHDLKNPFSSSLALSELLQYNFEYMNDDEKKELVDKIVNLNNDILQLLDNLLNWAITHTGKMDINIEEFNINCIIQSVKNLTEHQANEKNIKIEEVNIQDIFVRADENMISTCIRNLITNAIKFTYPNGNIQIKSNSDENYVYLSIIDNGIGMKEDILKNIFKINEKNTRRGTSNEKGTGFGLILVKEFIELNNGFINVESKDGEGSTFTLSIPKA